MAKDLFPKESIQNFLRSVPTQLPPAIAAGMAIYLGDRLLRSKSFGMLKSAVEEWGRGQINAWGDGGLGEEEQMLLLYPSKSLLNMPITIRSKIWSFLNSKDLLVLREVCGQTQCDVDYIVGLNVTVDSRLESFEWVQHIAVKTCTVKYLQHNQNWDIFAKPNFLQEIDVHECFPIDIRALDSILQKFENLKKLTVCMEDTADDGDGFHTETVQGFITLISKQNFRGLKVVFLPQPWLLQWTMNSKNSISKNLKDNIREVQNWEYIYLSMPSISRKHRDLWFTILGQQDQLQSLKCNLGETNSEMFEKIITKNTKTLTKISLSHIVNYPNRYKSMPFDWSMFKDCHNLKIIQIMCDRSVKPSSHHVKFPVLSSINFEMLPTENLEGILFSHMSFQQKDLQLMTSPTWGTKLRQGLIMFCALGDVDLPACLTLSKTYGGCGVGGYHYPLLGAELEEENKDYGDTFEQHSGPGFIFKTCITILRGYTYFMPLALTTWLILN